MDVPWGHGSAYDSRPNGLRCRHTDTSWRSPIGNHRRRASAAVSHLVRVERQAAGRPRPATHLLDSHGALLAHARDWLVGTRSGRPHASVDQGPRVPLRTARNRGHDLRRRSRAQITAKALSPHPSLMPSRPPIPLCDGRGRASTRIRPLTDVSGHVRFMAVTPRRSCNSSIRHPNRDHRELSSPSVAPWPSC
jgi:hypothetical protein